MNIEPENQNILEFLQKIDFFNHLTKEELKELAVQFQVVICPGGTLLMKEGEFGEDLYLVLHGRLSISVEEHNHIKVVADLGTGEVVGEISILIDAPRTATVRTVRESILLKLNKKIFEKFTSQHPLISLEIAKKCIVRLTSKIDKKKQGQVKTIAFVPITGADIINTFIENFSKEASHALILHSKMIKEKFDTIDNNQELIAWLNEKEFHYEYIFFMADTEDTLWTQLCLRQADSVYFLCDADQKEDIPNLQRTFFYDVTQTRNKYLFLLHKERNYSYNRTFQWSKSTKVDQFFHLVPFDLKDIKKALRIATGKSVGIVLSGGGARGAAHIGFLRALDELGIPIDIIGGTSIGGVIAALYALGYDAHKLSESFREIIVHGSKLDYTFPYVSVAAGKNLVKSLKKYGGENQMIDDLWLRMFCVSSNITQNLENIHKSGLLWKALRATVSLPGIYPPLFEEEGLLVDGGYINNLPVDIMKEEFHAGRVIASSIMVSSETSQFSAKGETFSGWDVLLNKLNPFKKTSIKVPRIDTIIMRSMNVNDFDRQKEQALHADQSVSLDMSGYSLMDYILYEKIIEAGYRQAIDQLKR
jgi:predicted acylesterase/phospholipase RssA/CRP-like cAMP-binding protein